MRTKINDVESSLMDVRSDGLASPKCPNVVRNVVCEVFRVSFAIVKHI